MKKYLEILKKCPLFFNIEDDKLLTMLNCLGAKVVSFDKKYTVLAEGTPAKYIGVVLTGSAQILQIDYYGNRSILGKVGPSEMFNEAFACAETNAIPVTVIANEPSEIMLIDCSHILHTCHNNCGFHQQLIFNLMKEFDQRTKKEEKASRIDHKEEKQKEEEMTADVINESGDAEISREGDDLGLNEN